MSIRIVGYNSDEHQEAVTRLHRAEFEAVEGEAYPHTLNWFLRRMEAGNPVVAMDGQELAGLASLTRMKDLPDHALSNRRAYERWQRNLALARGDDPNVPREELEKWLQGFANHLGFDYTPPTYFDTPFVRNTRVVNPDDVEFGEAIVAPKYRGQGIYRAMFGTRMDIVTSLADAEAIFTASLMDRPEAGRIQKQFGFEPFLAYKPAHPNGAGAKFFGKRITD